MKKKIHKMGKSTGYEKEGDKIFPAPMYTDQWKELIQQEAGVKTMLKVVTNHAQESLTNIIKQKDRLWDRIENDLDLDLSKYEYTYNIHDRAITQKPKPQDPDKKQQKK